MSIRRNMQQRSFITDPFVLNCILIFPVVVRSAKMTAATRAWHSDSIFEIQ